MSTTGIIIKREYVERIKSRSFIIGTALVVIGMFALALLPFGFRWLGSEFTSKIVVVAPDSGVAAQVAKALSDEYDVSISKDRATGATLPADVAQAVKSKKYDAALLAYRTSNGLAFAFYPRQTGLLSKSGNLRSRLAPVAINVDLTGQTARSAKQALNFQLKTVALNERYQSEQQENAASTLVYILLILLYIGTILYAVQIAQGVIEEKSNRVMEVMIAAVRPAQLLAGKIFGIGALALTQMVIFALAAAGALILLAVVIASTMSQADAVALAQHAAAAQANAPGGAGVAAQGVVASAVPYSTLVYLVVFFILGFFSYAALFAGMGALCSKAEDVQQFNGVMMIPIIIAYFIAIFAVFGDPEKPLFVVASMIPLISPMVMFTRVALSSVPAWQIALSIAFSLAAIWGLTLLAGRLYRVGVLMYGKPPRLGDVVRALRAPT
ncbi:MAG: ABC transporter permease [Candidatus Eremiobacteraeota bacterium]|nr:ABC transporter permease [Candidatus Eremiobacteraeota bacterium]MBV8365761.1 ABC transporter permease [Candidatus Eremiobacteraeota bacterium]